MAFSVVNCFRFLEVLFRCKDGNNCNFNYKEAQGNRYWKSLLEIAQRTPTTDLSPQPKDP